MLIGWSGSQTKMGDSTIMIKPTVDILLLKPLENVDYFSKHIKEEMV